MIMIIMIMILMRIIKTDSTANNYDDFGKIIAIMYDSDIVDVVADNDNPNNLSNFHHQEFLIEAQNGSICRKLLPRQL